jgi:hypothetical protein
VDESLLEEKFEHSPPGRRRLSESRRARMGQAIQMGGALIVLSGFLANQRMGLSSDSALFLLLNAVGTAILAVVAGVNHDLGFVLVEGVWAVVSTLGVFRAFRREAATARSVS